MERIACRLMAGAVAAILAAGAASAADSEINRRSLKGIQAVRVLVEMRNLDDEGGLHPGRVRAELETQLRQAGIALSVKPGTPYLYVNVEAVKHGDLPVYGYIVDVELRQAARVVLHPDIVVFADTWSIHSIGTATQAELAAHLRVKLATHVDLFIEAYRAMNPRH